MHPSFQLYVLALYLIGKTSGYTIFSLKENQTAMDDAAFQMPGYIVSVSLWFP